MLVIDGRGFFQVSLGGKVPFPDIGIFIPCFLHIVGNGLYIQRQGNVVAEAPCLCWIQASLEQGPARPTDGLGRKCLVKTDPFLCKLVYVRGYCQFLAIAPTGIGTLLVRKIKNNIRLVHESLHSLFL